MPQTLKNKMKTRSVHLSVFSFFLIILILVLIPTDAVYADNHRWWHLPSFVIWIGGIFLQLGAYIAWFGGLILETAIDMLVINMDTLIGKTTDVGKVINISWTVIRDFCNLAFIFGFVWIGIKTIIDYDSGTTKKFLASLIIGALLINFSLFITRVVVDVSNVMSESFFLLLRHPWDDKDLSVSSKYHTYHRSLLSQPHPQNMTRQLQGRMNCSILDNIA